MVAPIYAHRLPLAPLLQDLHVAIYDHGSQYVYTANARKDDVTTGQFNAYDRQYNRLDMTALFAEQPPQI